MNLDKLKLVLQTEPEFRFKQAWRAVFKDLISDWDENTTLPASLRAKLNKEAPLVITGRMFNSKDGETAKALLILEDKNKIETVLLRHNDGRNTVCVSAQVGCPLACKFCATGLAGYKRNLTVSEILSQIIFFERHLKDKSGKVTNVVFMGMGEPFLNFDNVMRAISLINDQDSFNIGARHISVSTSGIVEGINKLAQAKLPINLAISLHAPNDKLRSQLMPINKKYPLPKLMAAVKNYVANKSRQVMFEYLMLNGLNDNVEQARELALLLQHPLYVVNLIRYNPTGSFQPSTPARIKKFKNILLRAKIKITQRHGFGLDIKAACGQLAGQSANTF